MTMDDYRGQVKSDLLDFARESWECDNDTTTESIMEEAWTADSVTGNGSGSYTFNSYEAEQNVSEVIWDEELLDMFKDFGYDRIPLEKGAEYIDVSIRCFLVNEFEQDVQDLLNELNANNPA